MVVKSPEFLAPLLGTQRCHGKQLEPPIVVGELKCYHPRLNGYDHPVLS